MADPCEKCPCCGEALLACLDENGCCSECGTVIRAPRALSISKKRRSRTTKSPVDRDARNLGGEDRAKSRPTRPKRRSGGRNVDRPHNPYLARLRFLSRAYFPFLGSMVLASALGGIVLCTRDSVFAFILGVLLIVTSGHILLGLCALFQRVEEQDEFEIELPEEWQLGLKKLVEQVASERRLAAPDVIRLHVESLAHVYMDRNEKAILVLGGTLIALLPQHALAGIIAHELSHFSAGDVQRSRRAVRWHRVMQCLEWRFLMHRWAVWNPLVWLIRLYHHIYFRLLFASQRCEEFLADSYYVDQVGEEAAATTLVLLNVLDNMPWTNLTNMAENLAMANDRVDFFFAEQVRRLRAASKSDWELALRKALREETHWYSTHPSLKARLKPLALKARDILPLAMNLAGEPATALFANWPVVEKYLSQKIMAVARIYFGERRQAIEDIAALVKRF